MPLQIMAIVHGVLVTIAGGTPVNIHGQKGEVIRGDSGFYSPSLAPNHSIENSLSHG